MFLQKSAAAWKLLNSISKLDTEFERFADCAELSSSLGEVTQRRCIIIDA